MLLRWITTFHVLLHVSTLAKTFFRWITRFHFELLLLLLNLDNRLEF